MLPLEGRSLPGGCCHGDGPQPSSQAARPTSTSHRSRSAWEMAAGALSLGVWVLMPKCPVCLAAYVALWTGLGLSFTAATTIRWSLLALSALLLLYVAVRRGTRLRRLVRH
jgi:hypothetical protein